MFVLSEIKDYIRIQPCNFNKSLKEALSDELNKKLANKVVMNVGLCIALWDITKIGDSHLIPGDGCCHTLVNFRYVVFRPFMTEILIGKVKSCNREGVTVTLGFFDDIIIPRCALQHPSRFDESEQVWVWEYQVSEDADKHDLYMDLGEPIRFRVTDETFEETSPSGPDSTSDAGAAELAEPKVPYTLTGSINESGLGLLSWWASL